MYFKVVIRIKLVKAMYESHTGETLPAQCNTAFKIVQYLRQDFIARAAKQIQ